MNDDIERLLSACDRARAYARLMDEGAWDWACHWSLMTFRPIYMLDWVMPSVGRDGGCDGAGLDFARAHPTLFGGFRPSDDAGARTLAYAGMTAARHPRAFRVAAMQTLGVTDPYELDAPDLTGPQSSLSVLLTPVTATAVSCMALDGRWGADRMVTPDGRTVHVGVDVWRTVESLGLRPPADNGF